MIADEQSWGNWREFAQNTITDKMTDTDEQIETTEQ